MKRHIEYLEIQRNYTKNSERNKAITPTSKKKKKKKNNDKNRKEEQERKGKK